MQQLAEHRCQKTNKQQAQHQGELDPFAHFDFTGFGGVGTIHGERGR